MTEVIIGSRESKLAVLQSEMVKSYIEQKNREKNAGSEITVNILTMKTTGDIILDRTLDKVGGKGLFVKELDRALLDGKSNLSVHSLKDMPMEVPKELPLLAFSKREDPRDVLVLPEGVAANDLPIPTPASIAICFFFCIASTISQDIVHCPSRSSNPCSTAVSRKKENVRSPISRKQSALCFLLSVFVIPNNQFSFSNPYPPMLFSLTVTK